MKRILYAALFLSFLTGGSAMAQQQPQFSHYGFNGMYLSPGYAGMNKATEFNVIGRYQWFNYKADFNDEGGSPKTGLFNVSIPIRAIKGGIGINAAYDELAATKYKFANISYSYHLEVGGGVLGIGVQAGATNISKGTVYRPMDDRDPHIPANSSDTKLDAGAGLWYSGDKFYAGAGINNLLGAKYQFETEQVAGLPKEVATVEGQQHLYVTAGYNIDASSSLVITPTALLKYDLDSNPSFDIGARGTINEKYWVGLNYRHQEAITGMLGMGLTKDNALRLGYAFDFTTFESDAKAVASHEILLSYRIPQSPLATKPAIKTPRYSF